MSADSVATPGPAERRAVHRTSVVVIGAGAMGGTFAGALASAGLDVVVIDPAPEIGSSLREHGLRVTHADGSMSRHEIRYQADAAGLEPPDFVFFFVKAVHNEAAARGAAHLIGPDTIVATVQNGIGHTEVLSSIVPLERLVVGVTNEGANALEPGHVYHYNAATTTLGPAIPFADIVPAERVAEVLTRGGLSATAVADSLSGVWSKLVFNSAYSGVAAVTGLSLAGLGSEPHVWELCKRVARETGRIATLSGATVDVDAAIARAEQLYASAVAATSPAGKASMLLDIEAHRHSEVDALNGAVVRAAHALGEEAPLNAALHALVRGIEHSWTSA